MTAAIAASAAKPLVRIGRFVRFAIGLVCLAAVAGAAALLVVVCIPVLAGDWSLHAVRTGSMRPTLETGDVVLVSPPPTAAIAPGTIIQFERDGRTVTHRVVAVTADGSYRTRGDANAVADSDLVAPHEVRGVVRVAVPFLGYPRAWTQSHRYGHSMAGLALFAMALWMTRYGWARRFDPWCDR